MTNEEKSLILYLEFCLVDNSGCVCDAEMNASDFEIAQRWSDEGLIGFGRIQMCENVDSELRTRRHWVTFSPKAWELAHAERRAKAECMSMMRLEERGF